MVLKVDSLTKDHQGVLMLTKRVVLNRFLGGRMLLLCLLAVHIVLMIQCGVPVPIILRRAHKHERTVRQGRKCVVGDEGSPLCRIHNSNGFPNVKSIPSIALMLDIVHQNNIKSTIPLGVCLLYTSDAADE